MLFIQLKMHQFQPRFSKDPEKFPLCIANLPPGLITFDPHFVPFLRQLISVEKESEQLNWKEVFTGYFSNLSPILILSLIQPSLDIIISYRSFLSLLITFLSFIIQCYNRLSYSSLLIWSLYNRLEFLFIR